MCENKKLSKREKALIKITIFMFLFVLGFFLNINVKFNNNFKMPVYFSGKNLILDEQHFQFSNKSKVNFFYLTDIFYFPFFNIFFSIGDVLICIGLIGFFYSLIELIFVLILHPVNSFNFSIL